MSDNLNLHLEQSFRAVAQALDATPEHEEVNFLARLVLVLADEIRDGERFQRAVERACLASQPGGRA
jgi:hypothetical protein